MTDKELIAVVETVQDLDYLETLVRIERQARQERSFKYLREGWAPRLIA